METEDIKNFVIECLEEKKAENITCMKLEKEVSIAEYMIFASGKSTKNIKSVAEFVALELKNKKNYFASLEGLQNSEWVLIDLGNIIVHLFHPETREKFKVEELWKGKSAQKT